MNIGDIGICEYGKLWNFAVVKGFGKDITVAQLADQWEQFTVLRPSITGFISIQNFNSYPLLFYYSWSIINIGGSNLAGCDKEPHQFNEGFMAWWALDYANMVMSKIIFPFNVIVCLI